MSFHNFDFFSLFVQQASNDSSLVPLCLCLSFPSNEIVTSNDGEADVRVTAVADDLQSVNEGHSPSVLDSLSDLIRHEDTTEAS